MLSPQTGKPHTCGVNVRFFNVEPLGESLISTHLSFLVKYLNLLPVLRGGCLCFLTVELRELLIHPGCKSCVKCVICKHFLPAWGLSFHSPDCFFHGARVFNKVSLIIKKRKRLCFGATSKNGLPTADYEDFPPQFSSSSFIALFSNLRVRIHFELTCAYGVRVHACSEGVCLGLG